MISPKKNLWHCLGACQAGGSVIDWVMKSENVSFAEAVELLRADLPSLAVPAARRGSEKAVTLANAAGAEDQKLLALVAGHYNEALKRTPPALAYLAGRGLRTSEMIDHFKLGFADRTLAERLPQRSSAEGKEIRSRLERLGIYRSTGHEHFHGSVVPQILDEHGAVMGMYGRKISSELKPDAPRHLYLPGPHRGVFNVQALAASKEIILCEALIDALTFWCAGFRNVTSSYGVSG